MDERNSWRKVNLVLASGNFNDPRVIEEKGVTYSGIIGGFDIYRYDQNDEAQEYPKFISPDSMRFRRNRQLNDGYYIEVNLWAKDIYWFCMQAIETIGLISHDWVVESD